MNITVYNRVSTKLPHHRHIATSEHLLFHYGLYEYALSLYNPIIFKKFVGYTQYMLHVAS